MPFNPAIERLMPNLRYRKDGIQVRKIMATKLAPTNTAIRMRTMGCPKISRSVDRRLESDRLSAAWVAPRVSGRSDWPRLGSFNRPRSKPPSTTPRLPNR